jgi:hypothetical protein
VLSVSEEGSSVGLKKDALYKKKNWTMDKVKNKEDCISESYTIVRVI